MLPLQTKFYLGLPKGAYFIVKTVTEITNLGSIVILITLKKIRLNDPYERLGLDFGISARREVICICKV